MAVAFDVGKTFRHDMYDAYKGHRERMPDELRSQVERMKQVVETLNIPIFTAEGFEADDVWQLWHARPERRKAWTR